MTSEKNIINHLNNNYDRGIIKEVRRIEKLEHRLAKRRNARTLTLDAFRKKVITSGCRIKLRC